MELTHAHYLHAASERCGVSMGNHIHERTKPSIEQLAMWERVGGRSAIDLEGNRWVFGVEKLCESVLKGILLEDPDVVAGKYRRDSNFFLFIGDRDGAFVAKASGRSDNHGRVLRDLAAAGVVVRDEVTKHSVTKYSVTDAPLPESVAMAGRPKAVSYMMSGVVLPKQPDMDSTYFSFWTNSATMMLPVLLEHFSDLPKPFTMEKQDTDSLTGEFYTVPIQ